MLHHTILRRIAERYHRALPAEIRTYLRERGIPATLIVQKLLGWNGERITIPIFGRTGDVLGFRYAKGPGDASDRPDVVSSFGLGAELYGWEVLARKPKRVVICARELDRLALEANDIRAVTSTGGSQPFPAEWFPFFAEVRRVYICFDRDFVGAAAARKLQRLLPRAVIVTLPPEVGVHGTVTDYFVDLGRTKVDFEMLLAAAAPKDDSGPPPAIPPTTPRDKAVRRKAEGVRRVVRLVDVVANYTDLEASGRYLAGQCPFHADSERSFVIYLETDAYSCTSCGAVGDVVRFLMDKESMTVGQAVQALERFAVTGELYGAA